MNQDLKQHVKDGLGTQYVFNPNVEPDHVIEQYRGLAGDYDEKMDLWEFLAPIQSRDILLQFVPKNAKILEAGCGTGLSGKLQYEAGYKNMHGLDISKEMLAIAKAKGVYQSLKQGNLLEPLPYSDASFDAVECVAVLTHILDANYVLRQFHRVIKPGGLIIFSQRKDLYESRDMASLLETLVSEGLLEKVHQTDWMPYITNHEEFVRNNIRVGYFVFRVA
jgi:ubiquinone/menaquinone biosynthesis C-methylase UbiE